MRYSVFRRVIASPYASASRLSLHGTAVAPPRCYFSDIQHLVLGASRQCTVAFLLRRASAGNPHDLVESPMAGSRLVTLGLRYCRRLRPGTGSAQSASPIVSDMAHLPKVPAQLRCEERVRDGVGPSALRFDMCP